MAYFLKYGDGTVEVPLSDDQIAYVVNPNPKECRDASAETLIDLALDFPIGTGKLEDTVKPGEKVCIVISDGTRSWQKPAVILKKLLERLNSAGIQDKDVYIISGRGTHRAQSDEDLAALVSPEIYSRVAFVHDHDPLDEKKLTYVGTTSRGTRVLLNSDAVKADRVILVGSVLHHFLAGFSGGRKSVLPGIAAYETVQQNHALSLAASSDSGSGFLRSVRSGNLIDNPVQLDMCEAAAMLNPDFIVNTVVDEEYNIIKVFAGDLFKAHKEACELVNKLNAVEIPKKVPVVIASAGGYPKDINVYQPLKTLCHMTECVSDGGTIIMLSESREGFGSADAESQMKDYDNMADREKALKTRYSIGGATGFLYAEAAEKYNFIYVTKLPKEEFSKTKMKIASSLVEALSIIPSPGPGEVCLMPNGSVTLPVLKADIGL